MTGRREPELGVGKEDRRRERDGGAMRPEGELIVALITVVCEPMRSLRKNQKTCEGRDVGVWDEGVTKRTDVR